MGGLRELTRKWVVTKLCVVNADHRKGGCFANIQGKSNPHWEWAAGGSLSQHRQYKRLAGQAGCMAE